MIKKKIARSRPTNWSKAFSVLLIVALLTALLLIAVACSFGGPEGAGASYSDSRIESSQLSQAGSEPIKLCSVNWED